MTTAILSFAVPPSSLPHDASLYETPEIGPTWPQEPHDVILNDLKPELLSPGGAKPLMKQLESRGFAIVNCESEVMGTLERQGEWVGGYLYV